MNPTLVKILRNRSCDFLMQNFDARQAALEQEMESLYEARFSPQRDSQKPAV